MKKNQGQIIRWQAPGAAGLKPPEPGHNIAEELKKRPGVWALVKEGYTNSGWGTIYSSMGFERACRVRHDITTYGWNNRPGPGYDIYLRWPEENEKRTSHPVWVVWGSGNDMEILDSEPKGELLEQIMSGELCCRVGNINGGDSVPFEPFGEWVVTYVQREVRRATVMAESAEEAEAAFRNGKIVYQSDYYVCDEETEIAEVELVDVHGISN